MLAAAKLSSLLTTGNALRLQINTIASSANQNVPNIPSSQIVLSSATPDMADKNLQFTYPRVCLYSTGLKNSHTEKFRSLSGTVLVIADIWVSANLLQDADSWSHFYVEAVTKVLRQSIGDWGDGIFFSGTYDVQFQAPKAGGFGFVELARVICNLNVSRN
jgi:hypothetical protein